MEHATAKGVNDTQLHVIICTNLTKITCVKEARNRSLALYDSIYIKCKDGQNQPMLSKVRTAEDSVLDVGAGYIL